MVARPDMRGSLTTSREYLVPWPFVAVYQGLLLIYAIQVDNRATVIHARGARKRSPTFRHGLVTLKEGKQDMFTGQIKPTVILQTDRKEYLDFDIMVTDILRLWPRGQVITVTLCVVCGNESNIAAWCGCSCTLRAGEPPKFLPHSTFLQVVKLFYYSN